MVEKRKRGPLRKFVKEYLNLGECLLLLCWGIHIHMWDKYKLIKYDTKVVKGHTIKLLRGGCM